MVHGSLAVRAKSLLVNFLIGCSLSLPSASALELTSQGVVHAVQDAKVMEPGTAVTASIAGSLVSVGTERKNSGSVEIQQKVCKVNALLIGKAVMDRFPAVATVRCSFWDNNRATCWTIDVHHSDVGYFSLGEIDQEKLIASLIIQTSSSGKPAGVTYAIMSEYSVANGHNKDGRMGLCADLVAAAKNGMDVAALWKEFIAIETRVRRGEGDATDSDVSVLRAKAFAARNNANAYSEARKLYAQRIVADEEARHNIGRLSVSYGYEYKRRYLISKSINDLALGDPSLAHWAQALFANNLEPAIKRGDNKTAEVLMAKLEAVLGIRPQ